MPTAALQPRRHPAWWLPVALLHVAALYALMQSRSLPRMQAAGGIEMRVVTPPPTLTPLQQKTGSTTPSPGFIPAPPAVWTVLAPPELVVVPAPTVPASGVPVASEPLHLQLPIRMAAPPTMLDQVRQDPRSHSAPVTIEHRIADAAGTLPVQIMDSTDGSGSKLVRQGSKCTRVTPSRIGTLNPMDPRATSLPSVSGACYH